MQDLAAFIVSNFRDSRRSAVRAEYTSVEYLAATRWIKRSPVEHDRHTLARDHLGDLGIELIQKRIGVIEPLCHSGSSMAR